MPHTNPILGLLNTVRLMATGRVRFKRGEVGCVFTMEDGRRFSVFRRVVIAVPEGTPDPAAVFVVRFTPARMGPRLNKIFSLLPLLVFMGFTGFRSKYWCVDEKTGMCQGIYEWQTRGDAERYAKSIAMRFMARRSVPGSVSARIVDQERLGAYAASRS